MTAAAAISLPFAWVDRATWGPVFQAALAVMFSLWAFSAFIAQLMPGGGAASAVETGAMALAGAFMFSALEALRGRNRYSTSVFAAAILIALAVVVPPVSRVFAHWNSVGAWFWTSCTASGLLLYVARGGRWHKLGPQERLVLTGALAFAVVNIAQLVRMTTNPPGAESIMLLTVPAVLVVIGVLASTRLALQFVVTRPRYEKSGLSDPAAQELFSRIERLMAQQKPFKAANFDRERLGALLGVDARYVGEALNRASGTSVAAYLRRQRLMEADRLLAAPENKRVSLEALGMQAGFGSRSRFYAAFEEAYGETPGDRRQRLQESKNDVPPQRDGHEGGLTGA